MSPENFLSLTDNKAIAKDVTNHSYLLENAITCGIDNVALKLIKGASEFSADGILDIGEFHRQVSIAKEILRKVNQSIEISKAFMVLGEYIGQQNGLTCVCYDFKRDCTPTWERCEKCPKGKTRFVPTEFYNECLKYVAIRGLI